MSYIFLHGSYSRLGSTVVMRKCNCRVFLLLGILTTVYAVSILLALPGQPKTDMNGNSGEDEPQNLQRYTTNKKYQPVSRHGTSARHNTVKTSNTRRTKIEKLPASSKDIENDSFFVAYQDDPRLVSLVRQSLHLPAPLEVPYNLTNPERLHFSQYNQSVYLTQELLIGMREGFFVELGALDGEAHSNTLYLERELGWKGLLIEPNLESFRKLTMKRRKSYSLNAGISLTNKSAIVYFKQEKLGPGSSRIIDDAFTGTSANVIRIKAFPLYTVLLAVNVTMIDFLSLDVEGDELKVLKSIPWNKIKVRVMCVEVNHIEEGISAVVSYMESQGYVLINFRDIDAWFAQKELLKEKMGKKLRKASLEYHLIH